MSTDNFIIESDDLSLAQNICKCIENEELRNRATANNLASNIATKFFTDCNYNVDNKSGLHNISMVLEDIEVSDLYLDENYIDVRLTFDENNVTVPVSHFENKLLPTAYMFILLNEDLSGGSVLGFIAPENIDTEKRVGSYYQINVSDLTSFYDIEILITHNDNDNLVDDKDLFDYSDNKLNNKNLLYKKLLSSKQSRLRLADIIEAKNIFNFVSLENNNDIDAELLTSSNEDHQQTLDENTTIEEIEALDEDDDIQPMDEIDTLDEDDIIQPMDEIDTLDEDDAIQPMDEIEALDENDDIQPIDEIEALDEVDDIQPMDEIEALDENDDIQPIDEIEVLDEDNEIQPMDEIEVLDEDNEIQPMDEIEVLDEDNEIQPMDEIEALDEDNEIQPMDKIEPLDENNDIQPIDEINIQVENDDIQTVNSVKDIEEINVTQDTNNEQKHDDILETEEQAQEIINNNINTNEQSEDSDLEVFNELIDENSEKDSQADTLKYSTETTPSINKYESSDEVVEEVTVECLEYESNDENNKEEYHNTEAIGSLFSEETQEETEEELPINRNAKKSISPISLIIILLIIGAIGYLIYTKFLVNNDIDNNAQNPNLSTQVQTQQQLQTNKHNVKTKEAMPIETIETAKPQNIVNEETSSAIPLIEQNLDASILVSNLKINWEVPAGYASNVSAKRYLIKIGKIIQLNLKTELLLLNKPPITNQISVEIKYNTNTRKFEAGNIIKSSGEKAVDQTIKQTINSALSMNLNMNTDSFAKLQGNPVLVINL